MSSYLDLYKNRLQNSGLNMAEIQRNKAKKDIEDKFATSPSVEKVKINNSVDFIETIIVEDSISDSTANDKKIIIMQPEDTLNVGDYIHWDNSVWLCTSKERYGNLYDKGIIQVCNNILKFYNQVKELCTIDCIVGDGNLDVTDNRFVSLSTDEFMVYCQNNLNTLSISLDSRFILSGDVYKVNGINKLTKVGLIELKIKKDILKSSDNLELGIADWDKGQNEVIIGANVITITPNDSTLKINRSITLQAHYMNGSTEDLSKHFTWSIVNSDGSSNVYATIVPSDKTCVVSANGISNKSVIVRAKLSSDNSIYTEKEIKIINLF